MTKLQATEIVPLPISNAHQDLMNCSSDESAGEEVEGDSDDEFAREMGDEIRSTMPFLCKVSSSIVVLEMIKIKFC